MTRSQIAEHFWIWREAAQVLGLDTPMGRALWENAKTWTREDIARLED